MNTTDAITIARALARVKPPTRSAWETQWLKDRALVFDAIRSRMDHLDREKWEAVTEGTLSVTRFRDASPAPALTLEAIRAAQKSENGVSNPPQDANS